MFIGIDLGTSSVKAVLVDEDQRIVATASAALTVSRPHPGFSEQDPEDWWQATLRVMDELAAARPREMTAVRGIGLSGQMHGAVLLDAAGRVLRPAILWNDTRSVRECAEFEQAVPDLHDIAGNLAMPGFTAPKLLWVRRHEPDLFARTAKVFLPKTYIQWRLTGEEVSDMSDAAGTLWLDVAGRRWSDRLLAATGLDGRAMPRLVEGSAPAGRLLPALAARWKFAAQPVLAGGAGDNAAGAIGLGAIAPGSAFLSLGTSGVLWATTTGFAPYPTAGVHAFCHALPGLWHQMGVTLSAAASLAWWAGVCGCGEDRLIAELPPPASGPSPALFLPYLAGERTPHNDGAIRGAFLDLASGIERGPLTQAVLEGVAFSFRDSLDALRASGTRIESADVIGGGSRSDRWAGILASVLEIPLHRVSAGDRGAAFGAARLARLAAGGEAPAAVCAPPQRLAAFAPDPALAAAYAERLIRYRAAYPALKSLPA